MPKWAYEDMSSMQDYHWPGNIRELKTKLSAACYWANRLRIIGGN